MAEAKKATLMDAAMMDRAVTRIAHEILERNKGTEGLVLVGILRRGYPLARRVAERIEKIEGVSVPCGRVDITFYRDDLSHVHEQPVLNDPHIDVPVDGKTVVLLDDVIYTGRTVRAAIDALFSVGRPSAVRLAVMIDRGLRELPIRPDFVGKNIPTSHNEVIGVRLTEVDGEDAVVLSERQ